MSDGQARCAQRAALRVRAALKPLRGMLKGGRRQGCALHPQKQQQRQRPEQQQKRASCGEAGWVRLRGTLQVRPCKLGRAIHGAYAPATGPTPPSTDSRDLLEWHDLLLVGVDLGSTPWGDALRIQFAIIEMNRMDVEEIIHAWRGSTGHRETVEGGAVSECGVSAAWMRLPSLQGRTCGVPALRHRPAIPRNARCFCCFGCCRCFCGCRAQPC